MVHPLSALLAIREAGGYHLESEVPTAATKTAQLLAVAELATIRTERAPVPGAVRSLCDFGYETGQFPRRN